MSRAPRFKVAWYEVKHQAKLRMEVMMDKVWSGFRMGKFRFSFLHMVKIRKLKVGAVMVRTSTGKMMYNWIVGWKLDSRLTSMTLKFEEIPRFRIASKNLFSAENQKIGQFWLILQKFYRIKKHIEIFLLGKTLNFQKK